MRMTRQGIAVSRCLAGCIPGYCRRRQFRSDPQREDRRVASPPASNTWERYAWAAGIVFVLALLSESVIAVGVGLTHDDSAAKIARGLHDHEQRLVVIACVSIVYAMAFVIY